MTPVPLIEYRDIARRFTTRRGTVTACEHVDLTVNEGEFLAIVGPSGCGKSTLLNMAAGLLQPSAGGVFYRGEKVPEPNTRVGYMTQRDTLLPWRSVEDNVAIALELRGQDRPTRLRTAHKWLHRVGLKGFENAYPAQLSGGMRRRVSLAIALVGSSRVVILDEPSTGLDPASRRRLWRLVEDARARLEEEEREDKEAADKRRRARAGQRAREASAGEANSAPKPLLGE